MDFTRKARWVLDGHKTPDPVGSKCAGVVSRESVQIAFTYAALNGLDVCMTDSVTNIPKALHHLWTRVWNGKCQQSGYHAQGSLWWKDKWKRLQKPP